MNQLSKFKLTDFQFEVLSKIKLIPKGRVATYQMLAKAIDRPRAVRAVANALNINPLLIKFPCHRVVKNDGRVGGYVKGELAKIVILNKEGIETKQGKVINFKKRLYHFN